jgi:hypothetical protein
MHEIPDAAYQPAADPLALDPLGPIGIDPIADPPLSDPLALDPLSPVDSGTRASTRQSPGREHARAARR